MVNKNAPKFSTITLNLFALQSEALSFQLFGTPIHSDVCEFNNDIELCVDDMKIVYKREVSKH